METPVLLNGKAKDEDVPTHCRGFGRGDLLRSLSTQTILILREREEQGWSRERIFEAASTKEITLLCHPNSMNAFTRCSCSKLPDQISSGAHLPLLW